MRGLCPETTCIFLHFQNLTLFRLTNTSNTYFTVPCQNYPSNMNLFILDWYICQCTVTTHHPNQPHNTPTLQNPHHTSQTDGWTWDQLSRLQGPPRPKGPERLTEKGEGHHSPLPSRGQFTRLFAASRIVTVQGRERLASAPSPVGFTHY